MLYLTTIEGKGTHTNPHRPRKSWSAGDCASITITPDTRRLDRPTLLWTPTRDLNIPGAIKLGASKHEQVSTQTRKLVSNRLGVVVPAKAASLWQLVAHLMFGDMPWLTVRPRRDGLRVIELLGDVWAVQQGQSWDEVLVDPTDDFNRADGGLGANWTTISGISALRIVSNECAGPASNGDAGAYWSAATPSNDQFSEIACVVVGTDADWGPMCRVQTGAFTGYLHHQYTGAGHTHALTELTAGSFSQIATTSGGASVAPADVVRLETEGSTIRGLINAVQVLSTTDASIVSGRWGLFAWPADARMDNWQGGDLGAPPPASLIHRRPHTQHLIAGGF